MGRWRPPTPASSAYITPAGFEALQKELDDIWLRRRDVVKALSEAAAEGDTTQVMWENQESSALSFVCNVENTRWPVSAA